MYRQSLLTRFVVSGSLLFSLGRAPARSATTASEDNHLYLPDVLNSASPDLVLPPTSTPSATATVTITATPTGTLPVDLTPTATSTATATSTPTSTATTAPGTCPVLDTFDRADGTVGPSWGNRLEGYTISSNQLSVVEWGLLMWRSGPYGADQQVCIRVAAINSANTDAYFGLALKGSHDDVSPASVLHVLYFPNQSMVEVTTIESGQGWLVHASFPTAITVGDTLRAIAHANGSVDVYVNATLLGTADVSTWVDYAGGGYIGFGTNQSVGALLDDFGGGNWP